MEENQNNQIDISWEKRIKFFIVLQIIFLAVSPFAGGFHKKVWSMLDSSLLIVSLGITGLAVVLPTNTQRTKAFSAAILIYVFAVIDIAVNILLSGWIGWAE